MTYVALPHYRLQCLACGGSFGAMREDAQTCSPKCRKMRQRANDGSEAARRSIKAAVSIREPRHFLPSCKCNDCCALRKSYGRKA